MFWLKKGASFRSKKAPLNKRNVSIVIENKNHNTNDVEKPSPNSGMLYAKSAT